MIIVAGGDSFVYGSELSDSQSTFTCRLTGNHKYLCVASAGYSNQSIGRTVLQEIENTKHENLGVIVSWTYPSRYEFNFSFSKEAEWQSINPWLVDTFYPNKFKHKNLIDRERQGFYRRDFVEAWYKYVGSSEYWETYTSLKEIVQLQNYLDLNKIPYLFTCADTEWTTTETYKSDDQTIRSLRNQIDFTKWFFFPGNKGFYQWAVHNKYPIGETHPLEDAHRDAAELMKDKFYELVTKHLE